MYMAKKQGERGDLTNTMYTWKLDKGATSETMSLCNSGALGALYPTLSIVEYQCAFR